LSKLLWPQDLIFIYPRWQISQAIWWQYLFPLGVIGLLAALWWLRKRSRVFLAVFLLFIGTLFPALGYVNIYPFVYSFVADHFQYLACIAPLSLAAAAISYASHRMRFRLWTVQVPCGILLAMLGLLTWRQSMMYADMKTLWETTIARNPDCWMAYSNRGFGLLQEGRVDAAILDFESALRAKPDYAYAQNNLGEALLKQGRTAEAITHFKKALEEKQDYAEPYDNLGVILFQSGQWDAAISNLERAVKINPAYGDAHFNLGIVLQAKGDSDAAISNFERSLEINPDDADAHRGLGAALLAKGRTAEAIGQFQKAMSLKPDYVDAVIDLGNALVKAGRASEAADQFRKALAFRPNDENLRHQIQILSR
jgi:tetratricopeptide (TPR) repeat protein